MALPIITSENAASGPYTCIFLRFVTDSGRATILYTVEAVRKISPIILQNIIQPKITVHSEANTFFSQWTGAITPDAGYLVTFEGVLNPSHTRTWMTDGQGFPPHQVYKVRTETDKPLDIRRSILR